jgi:hypothetical protein
MFWSNEKNSEHQCRVVRDNIHCWLPLQVLAAVGL